MKSSLALAALLVTTPATAQQADLVIWGGPIYTGVEPDSVEAVVVIGGRIAFVGGKVGAHAIKGSKTEVIDLKGAALFPGFTDAHAHLRGIGERELSLNLEGSKSAAEATTRVKAYMAQRKPVGPVFGRGWIETGWPEGRFLNRDDLDPIAPDQPVILTRADGHALTANSAALKAAGITEATPAPDGGAILKDINGRLTGVLVDNAMGLARKLRTAPTEADRRAAFEEAFKVEAAYGWTGIHAMSVDWADVGLLEAMESRLDRCSRQVHAPRIPVGSPRGRSSCMRTVLWARAARRCSPPIPTRRTRPAWCARHLRPCG